MRTIIGIFGVTVTALILGCQYIGEFPHPARVVYIRNIPPSEGEKVYTNIQDELNALGFVGYRAACVSFFSGEHDCPMLFKLYESGQPYVINFAIQIDNAHRNIIYQFEEYRTDNIANRAPFTPMACAVLQNLNAYVAELTKNENIALPVLEGCRSLL